MACSLCRVAVVALITAISAGGPADLRAQTPQSKPSVTPPRDSITTEKPGTAVIKGRVVSAEGKPLRRAQVRVTAPTLRDARTASTDTEGHYELAELPAGRYTVRMSRSGYLSLMYGQKYPDELGSSVQLADGETVSGVDVALPRAGVIGGRVVDEIGEPVAGVMVQAMQQRYFQGRRAIVPIGGITRTDDTGQYRLIGLSPGEYYVLGTLRESWVVGGKDKTVMAFAPTYYAAATSLATAQRVRVGIGQDVIGIDFALAVGRAANVSGVALNAAGIPLPCGRISLTQEFRGPGGMSMMSVGSATAGADGNWRLASVAPGEYKLELRTADAAASERATQTLIVDGTDIEGLTLATNAGGTIAGQVIARSETGRSLPLSQLRIAARPREGPPPSVPVGQQNGSVDAEGKFQLSSVTGAQRLTVGGLPDGWALKQIEQDGRDLTDADIQLRSGERLDDVRVILTDRLTAVTGTVVTDRETPSSSGTVVVFSDDATLWGEGSRYVRGVRPTRAGEFEIKGLPPGDYRAIALEFLPEGDWNDPGVLQRLHSRGMRFSLQEGTQLNLRLQIRN